MSSVRMNSPRGSARQARLRAVTPAAHAYEAPVVASRPSPHKPSRRNRAANAAVRLLPGAVAPVADATAPIEQSAVSLAVSPVTKPTHPCILIVEDDPSAAHAIRDTLTQEGEPDWNIQVAEGGERALALVAAQSPRVVLLDIDLPDLDGAEVYRRLRLHPEMWKTHVLFLTAATSLDLHQRGVDAGVVLRKPFEMRELVGLVRTLVAS